MSFFSRKKDNLKKNEELADKFLEKELELSGKLSHYRHIIEIYEGSFEKILNLSNETQATIITASEILYDIRTEVNTCTKLIHQHDDSEIIDYPNCGICNKSTTTTTETSRFEKARPLVPYENIKCSLCQFVANSSFCFKFSFFLEKMTW